MPGSPGLAEFFKLDASFDPIRSVTHETVLAADGTRRTIMKEWKRTKRLGHGASGTVWLEQDMEGGHLRAVKEIEKKTSTTAPKVDYTRELEALGHLSKVRTWFLPSLD
jgi:hypothetical protein